MVAATPALETLCDALRIAGEGADPDGVHDARIATRRLDAWLRLAGMRVLRPDLRWLRRSLAEARDLDVLLHKDDARDLWPWLAEKRRAEQENVRAVLADERVAALSAALAALPPIGLDQARGAIRGLVRRVLRRGRRAEKTGEDAAIHDLRRADRTLRFGLEWVGAPSDLAVRLQSGFGQLSDAMALRRRRADHGDDASLLDAEIAERRYDLLTWWRAVAPDVRSLEAEWTSS
jgi:CHAD domain-containing protein